MTRLLPQDRDIPVGSLIIDTKVHRAIKWPLVEQIVARYDRQQLGVLVVSERQDGTLVVLDGAIRMEAVLRREGKEAVVPCKVYTGLTIDQEKDNEWAAVTMTPADLLRLAAQGRKDYAKNAPPHVVATLKMESNTFASAADLVEDPTRIWRFIPTWMPVELVSNRRDDGDTDGLETEQV